MSLYEYRYSNIQDIVKFKIKLSFRLKRPAYEIEMHKIIQDANVINATAVDFPCGDPNKLEDLGIINEGILSGIKVSIF